MAKEAMQGMATPPPPGGPGLQRPPLPLQQQQHPYYGSMGPVSMEPGQIPMAPMGPGAQHVGDNVMGPPPPHMMGGPMGPGAVVGTNGPPSGPLTNSMGNSAAPVSNNQLVNNSGAHPGLVSSPMAPNSSLANDTSGPIELSGQQPLVAGYPEGMPMDSEQPPLLQRQMPVDGMPFVEQSDEKPLEDGKKKKKKYSKKKKVEGSPVDGGAESGGADTADGGADGGGEGEGDGKPKKKKYKKRKKEEPLPPPPMMLVKGEDSQEYVRMEVEGEVILEPMGKCVS